MAFYHPMAVYIDEKDGKAKKLFTYDSVNSLADCKKVFDTWEDGYGYQMIVQFAQVYENGEKVGIHEFTNSGNPEEQYRMAKDWWD